MRKAERLTHELDESVCLTDRDVDVQVDQCVLQLIVRQLSVTADVDI